MPGEHEAAVKLEVSDRAKQIHAGATIVDAASVNVRPYELQRLGGVTAGAVAVGDGGAATPEDCFKAIARYLNDVHRHPDQLMIVTSVDDVRRARQENKFGIILHFQGLPDIQSIEMIEMFIRIGVKVMSLTYNRENVFGSGAGEREDRGITYFGRQVIRDMNRLGALVDLSHLGHRTAMEALETSTKPVALTHSNCYTLTPNVRNAKDELIKAVAQTGGFVGISVYSPFSDPGTGRFPTVEDVLNHIDYAVKLVGIDHVALGSDSSGGDDTTWWLYQVRHSEMIPEYTMKPPYFGRRLYHSVEGFPNMSALPRITEGMVRRGYSEADIHKFLGGNTLRVLEQVW